MTFPSIMGRKSQMRLDVLMSPGSTIEVRTYKDAFPHLVRGGHLSSRAPWVNNVSLRHHLAKNKVEYKKTRWNIDHRKLSYLHIPTSIWVPCAFRNVLSYGARFCVLQGKRNIHLICLGGRISPKMNVVG